MDTVNFSTLTVFARQVANGSMAVGALFVLAVFGRFLWTEWRQKLHSDTAVNAALAIFILTLGHCIRATSGWVEFAFYDAGLDISPWLWLSWSWFLLAAVLVITGKALMLFNFAPFQYRKAITIAGVVSSIAIPLAIALLI